jgi:hypothetical protein
MTWRLIGAVVVLLGAVGTGVGTEVPTLSGPLPISVEGAPQAMVVALVNRDRTPDVLVTSERRQRRSTSRR